MKKRNGSNALIHGRRSKKVQEFLEKHGMKDLELPSTGSIGKDIMLKVAILKEKQEAMNMAMEILRSQDTRALTMFSTLTEINMLLSQFEKDANQRNISLINNPHYLRWTQLKVDILKHYDRIKFDLTKLHAESAMQGRSQEDVLYSVDT
jgi:hypothetical protein